LEVDFFWLKKNFGLPFLLKPRSGFGSKGIVRVTSEDIFIKYRNDVGSVLLVQPIVGNDDDVYDLDPGVVLDPGDSAAYYLHVLVELHPDQYPERGRVTFWNLR
jgi:carbamoyl-phosphate synthase large subunit